LRVPVPDPAARICPWLHVRLAARLTDDEQSLDNLENAMTMVGPANPSRGARRPLGLTEVRLTSGFWAERQRLAAEAVLPHATRWIERAGWVDNVRVLAARGPATGRKGREFSDSEVYKLLEGYSWEAARSGRPAAPPLIPHGSP